MKQPSTQSKYECDICERTFLSIPSAKYHIKKHYNKKPKCDICDKELFSIKYLRRHLASCHLECKTCNKTFKTKERLDGHIKRVHQHKEPEAECKLCQARVSDVATLKKHMDQVHYGKKLLKCDYCEKRFYQDFFI